MERGQALQWAPPCGIPNDTSLLGAVVYCQVVQYGGVTPFALSNTQDLCVGL